MSDNGNTDFTDQADRRTRLYYIAFETYPAKKPTTKSWQIRRTVNDLDTSSGLQREINQMENERMAEVWIINWRELRDE